MKRPTRELKERNHNSYNPKNASLGNFTAGIALIQNPLFVNNFSEGKYRLIDEIEEKEKKQNLRKIYKDEGLITTEILTDSKQKPEKNIPKGQMPLSKECYKHSRLGFQRTYGWLKYPYGQLFTLKPTAGLRVKDKIVQCGTGNRFC
jgi:hypothetical protein